MHAHKLDKVTQMQLVNCKANANSGVAVCKHIVNISCQVVHVPIDGAGTQTASPTRITEITRALKRLAETACTVASGAIANKMVTYSSPPQ